MQLSEREQIIQVNLEQLNETGKLINKLENSLTQCRREYEHCLEEYKKRLNGFHGTLGKSIERSRRYYDASNGANEILWKMLIVSDEYCYLHQIVDAYERLLEYVDGEEATGDNDISSILRQKASDAVRTKLSVEQMHKDLAIQYEAKRLELKTHTKRSRRSITLSKPYFDLRAKFMNRLHQHRSSFIRMSDDLSIAKITYAQSLKRLETISEQIRKEWIQLSPLPDQVIAYRQRNMGVKKRSLSHPIERERSYRTNLHILV